MFPIEWVDDLWARKSEGVRLIVRAISFQDFQAMWFWTTNVTDWQTDDMQSQYRALQSCAIVHRAVKIYSRSFTIVLYQSEKQTACLTWGRGNNLLRILFQISKGFIWVKNVSKASCTFSATSELSVLFRWPWKVVLLSAQQFAKRLRQQRVTSQHGSSPSTEFNSV